MPKQTPPAEPGKFIRVEEVMDILQVSRSTAYHTMQKLNKELKDKGFITHAGRVSRSYLIDQYCKHALHIHYYIRYMDDIVILARTKEEAQRYLEAIAAFLREVLRLDLNNKNAIKPADRVEFVGYMVSAKDLKLRKATIRRMKESMRAISRKYFTGELSQEGFDRRVASYKGMIRHCRNHGLRRRLNEIYLHAKETYGGTETHEQPADHSSVIRDRGSAKQNHPSPDGEPAPVGRYVHGGGNGSRLRSR